jgi:hypothetical protein
MASERYQHIVIKNPPEVNIFTTTKSGRDKKRIPDRDRESHSAYLKRILKKAWMDAEGEQAVLHHTREGVYLEFESDPGFDLVTKSLENMQSKKIRLLNVRTVPKKVVDSETGYEEEKIITYATVYVAHEKKGYFLKKIQQYADEKNENGKPRNEPLVNSIASIRKALLVDSFWQDTQNLVPADKPEWCEVWLRIDSPKVISRFEALLKEQGIKAKEGIIRFPERAVKVVHANFSQLERLTTISDDIAEYRRAKETSAFWSEMPPREQAEWVKDLLARSRVDLENDISVCILDTGVNNGHPLLSPLLQDEDCQAVDSAWGQHDHDGHGTLMAGIAAYGELGKCLASGDSNNLRHCLESVKIVPQPPDQNKPDIWGFITSQGVSLAEIQAPFRKRIICMAITAADTRDRGRPSSWSGEIDQVTSGVSGDQRRLFIICTGNVEDPSDWLNYYSAQFTDSIHDPAQSWNALTVGAYTKLDQITDPSLSGYKPIAPRGGLSPFTTVSSTWENKWPIKPEIVMEGGNAAYDESGFSTQCDDLSPLSTFWKPTENYFHPFIMTSAASAQAAWFAAQIQSQYPEFWPETIRALMVHSAEWTDMLKDQFLDNETRKGPYAKLLRVCGYGVPSLERALYSASNSLTLISERELQPFDKKESGNGFRTKEMHLYDLPWPKDSLLALPDGMEVKMRITLSYFVEPGPGEVGWKDRYRYASHQLRFDVKSPSESVDEFMKRINKAVREEDEGSPGTQSASDYWLIGSNARNRGSIHSDIWSGNAAELAASNIIAIYPVIGWWRERHHLGKWNFRTRYSLIVSIHTPEETVDIYTPVANQVGIAVPVTIAT